MAHAWSDEQEAIFDWFAHGTGNLVVQARAGTGKTTTIVEAIQRAPEQKILLAAFNNVIARELRGRIECGWGTPYEVKTLHALGFAFCKQQWGKRLGVDNDVRAIGLARAALAQAGEQPPRAVLSHVARLNQKVRELAPRAATIDEVLRVAASYQLLIDDTDQDDLRFTDDDAALAVLACLELAAKAPTEGKIDFADMIFLPLRNGWCRPWFHLVVVDEAQDMSAPQLEIAQRACKRTGRIAVVGDDRQAIYGFRGADSGALARMVRELDATLLGLRTTYRCPRAVVAVAKEYVPDYAAAPEAPEGAVVDNKRVVDLIDLVKPGDFVLSRKNAPLVPLCFSLLRKGIPAAIRGCNVAEGLARRVRKLQPEDLADLVGKLRAWADRESEAALRKYDEDVAQARVAAVEDQREALEAIADGCADLAELDLRLQTLFSDEDPAGRVMLSTVHRAKGLEADTVYMLRDTFWADPEGEEVNLLYVAVTRAKQTLYRVAGEDTDEIRMVEE